MAFDSQLRFIPRVSRSACYRRKEWYRVYWFNRGSFVCGESEFIREFIFVILDFKTSRSSSFKQFSWRIKCVFIQRHSRTFNPKSQCALKWPSGPLILVCIRCTVCTPSVKLEMHESCSMTQIMSEITGYLFLYYHADPLGTNIQPSW